MSTSVFDLFTVGVGETGPQVLVPDATPVAHPFTTGAELLETTRRTGLRVSDVVLADQLSWRTEEQVRGGLHERRLAEADEQDPLRAMERVTLSALAVDEVLGGTPDQVEDAAEFGLEHDLGLTCDPVGGLVQSPCIERNAVGAVKAVTAARTAVRGDGAHHVSLDKAVRTMRQTGADMSDTYEGTARGGLALNLVEC